MATSMRSCELSSSVTRMLVPVSKVSIFSPGVLKPPRTAPDTRNRSEVSGVSPFRTRAASTALGRCLVKSFSPLPVNISISAWRAVCGSVDAFCPAAGRLAVTAASKAIPIGRMRSSGGRTSSILPSKTPRVASGFRHVTRCPGAPVLRIRVFVFKFTHMKILIVIQHRLDLWNAPPWFGERLRREFCVEVVQRNRYEGIETELQSAEVMFTLSLRPQQFELAKQLRWVHAPTAAVHQFMFPELINSEVVLTNSTEVHGPVVAEHVIALVFALAKKIPQAALLQRKRVWGQEGMWNEGQHLKEIGGATLGLIGVGSIGRRVAQMASGLGMRVIAVREHVEKGRPEGVETVFSPVQLGELLGQSDYVVVAAPLLPSTTRLIDAPRLAMMKPGAFLINVGRGPLVDEGALADALRSRRIAGAALDVFEHEPLPSDSPLWELDGLLITPHTAGLTEKLWDRHYALFSDNLRRYRSHERLRYVVDKHRGY